MRHTYFLSLSEKVLEAVYKIKLSIKQSQAFMFYQQTDESHSNIELEKATGIMYIDEGSNRGY